MIDDRINSELCSGVDSSSSGCTLSEGRRGGGEGLKRQLRRQHQEEGRPQKCGHQRIGCPHEFRLNYEQQNELETCTFRR